MAQSKPHGSKNGYAGTRTGDGTRTGQGGRAKEAGNRIADSRGSGRNDSRGTVTRNAGTAAAASRSGSRSAGSAGTTGRTGSQGGAGRPGGGGGNKRPQGTSGSPGNPRGGVPYANSVTGVPGGLATPSRNGATGSRSGGSRGKGGASRKGAARQGAMPGQQRMGTSAARTPTPPLVRREISGILLMAFGILLFMGIFLKDSAGSFGYILKVAGSGLFGVTAYALPFLVFGQGAYRMFARNGHPLWNRFFNVLLLLAFVSAMFQAGAHPKTFYATEGLSGLIPLFFREGVNTLDPTSMQTFRAGGVFGGLIGVPLLFVFQRAGAMVVLATLGIVIALVVTRISIVDAARSVARGTAGRIDSLSEAARRRREDRLALYEAQTREAYIPAARPGKATGGFRQGGSAAAGTAAGGHADAERAARERGGRFLDVDPDALWDMEEEGETGPSMRYPASFVQLDQDVGDLRAGEAEGGSAARSAEAATHLQPVKRGIFGGRIASPRDVRAAVKPAAGSDGDETDSRQAAFDPFTGEHTRPGGWTAALTGDDMAVPEETGDEMDWAPPPLDMPDPDCDADATPAPAANAGVDVRADADAAAGTGASAIAGAAVAVAAGKAGHADAATPDDMKAMRDAAAVQADLPNPKAEWLRNGLAPVPDERRSLDDAPVRDTARAWEDNLAREEAQRRTGGGGAPAFGQGGAAVEERADRPYTFPPVQLLKVAKDDEANLRRIRMTAEENARKLESTLESFGIGAKVNHISVGPAITRYELQPAPGIKVSRIVNLTDDIALNLASSGVRIEAPIPGKAAIGVEVPNKEVAPISLRSVLESKEFEEHPSKLAVALGKDISGENMVVDLAKMPHVLIAGATGSGKSVCINSIVISLLYKAKPEEVKLIMIDPKVVELGIYNGIPHLLIPVVTDPNKAAGALRWAVQEMVMRYKLFADKGVRDLTGYNAAVEETGIGMKLPQMVIIIDELADLMMVAPHDVEDSICRLAQMARAAGMHLVIATQRPSVNVITGVIKANVPSRVAFSVSSQVDSRTIIDMAGAEKLLGKGDMLYYPVGFPKPARVKGAFISDKEVELVVDHVKAQGLVKYDEDILDTISENQPDEAGEPEEDENDGLLDEAVEALIDSGQASVSFIQRRFKVGYARAGRIIDQMAEKGIISGYEGSKPRRVLITRDMWNEMRMQKEIRAAEMARAGKANEQLRMRPLAQEPVRGSRDAGRPFEEDREFDEERAMRRQREEREMKASLNTPRASVDMPEHDFASAWERNLDREEALRRARGDSQEDPGAARRDVAAQAKQPGDALRQTVVGSALESAFLRRAMADAEERERRQRTYGDALPQDGDDGFPDEGEGAPDSGLADFGGTVAGGAVFRSGPWGSERGDGRIEGEEYD